MKSGAEESWDDGDLFIVVTKITPCVWLVDVLHEDSDSEGESEDDESEDSGEVEQEEVAETADDPK